MSGYLEQYGAGEEKKEHLIRNVILVAAAVIVVGGLGIYLFHTHHQIAVTKNFLGLLRSKNYESAYAAWGCTSAKPCPEYTYAKFLEDWGPKSASGANPVLHITDSESCGTGVILTVDVSPGNFQKLYVGKDSDSLSFSPLPTCPGKSAWAIMAHRTLGRMRAVFF